MNRTRTLLTGGAIGLAAGVAALGWLMWIAPAPSVTAPPTGPGALAEITRGTLRDTKTVTGTLGYGELTAYRPAIASGSAMVTWIAAAGSIVERGQPLYALDGQNTILFYGPAPLHRTLRFDRGAKSPVWVELETARNSAATADLSLRLEQARLDDAGARVTDLSARLADALLPEPLTAEFAQLAGAVQAAQERIGRVEKLSAASLTPSVDVTAAQGDLAAARAALDGAVRSLRKELAAAQLEAVTARVGVADARARLDTLDSDLAALAARAPDESDVSLIAENLAALGYEGAIADQVRAWQADAGLAVTGLIGPGQLLVAPGPVHIATHGVHVGEVLPSPPQTSSILDYSSVDRLVTAMVGVGDQGLVAVGRAATITLPDDSRVEGRITEVGSVVKDGAIEVSIAIADQAALAGLEVAAVDVELVSSSRDDVLSVPVTALLAQSDGGFAVELAKGGQSVLVSVKTGLFAAGRVEIEGDGIAEGMKVGVPR